VASHLHGNLSSTGHAQQENRYPRTRRLVGSQGSSSPQARHGDENDLGSSMSEQEILSPGCPAYARMLET
jgi:hypothetical protein